MDRTLLRRREGPMTRLPDFLVIGAMKSGTTSLYEDLVRQPAIYFPPGQKEPHVLAGDRVLTAAGREDYARLYRGASQEQLCGDASTGYTKRPDVEGVALRAQRVLGSGWKAIYVVREPLARTISHHYHELSRGELSGSLDEAIVRYPRLIDYSRYAYQLRPWFDVLEADRIRVVRFEDYVADRRETISSLCHFLGIEANVELVDRDRVFGRTAERSVPRGVWWKASRSSAYRRFLRRLLPERSRDWFRRHLLPKPPPPPPAPCEETLRYLAERLAPEVEELQDLLGLSSPLWDLEAAILSHLRSGRRSSADYGGT
jgi:hypothetical protein